MPAVGDFNEDGHLDLAVMGDSGTVFVSLYPFSHKIGYPLSASLIAVADVNGDGHQDIVGDTGAVLLGDGNGHFTAGGGAISGRRYPDFARLQWRWEGGSAGRRTALLVAGNGDGTFQTPITAANGSSASLLGGFDLDGHLDLVGSGSLIWHTPAGLTPSSLSFGQQVVDTSSRPQPAILVNASAAPLAITRIVVNGANAQDFSQTNNCSSSLPAGANCQIQVTFTPMSAGDKSASLQVSYVGSFSPQSVALSGTGVVKQIIRVSLTPARITFPTQIVNTTSAPQTATLKNTGNTGATISSISASGPFGEGNNCPSTLPAGESCQIQVTFQPTKDGQVSGTLSVTDNAPNSPQTVALSGTGTRITFSPIGVNFGPQKVGTSSKPVPVTFSNKGAATLNISQVKIGGTNPGDFSQTNN
jgi:hypothetical protein